MWSVHIALLVVLSITGCNAELPKSTPQCSKDWGGWWDAFHCGTYPLHWAVASGNMNLTKKLLDQGADINLEDDQLWTPLIEAAFFGKQHLSVELIRRGADVYTKGGYLGINVVKVAKLKWCIMHSSVNTCPTTLYDYDRTIEVLFRGCEWTECVEGFRCVGRRCWPDKCHKVECPTNAGCVVENRKPVCRCNPGFVGVDANNTKCEEPSGNNKKGMKSGNLIMDPCPEGYYIFGSQCLYIDDMKKVHWKDASNRCKRKNGVLAKIENPGNFSLYLDEFYPRMTFWLGANDRKREGVWRWYSGELLAEDFPWGVNQGGKEQPNDGGSNEDCMSIKYFNSVLKTQYVDNKCSLKHYFVCSAPRNFVDDLPAVSNNVYSSIEVNIQSNDNIAQREFIDRSVDSESISINGIPILDRKIGQDSNSTDGVTNDTQIDNVTHNANTRTGGVNQTLPIATTNEILIHNVVHNATSDSVDTASTGTHRMILGQDGDIDADDERASGNGNFPSDINVENEGDSSNFDSLAGNINHNEALRIISKYNRNITDTNNHRFA